jgi:AraC-like DNA-binding protein
LSRVGAESIDLREVRGAGFSSILISGLDDDKGSLCQALGIAATQVVLEGVVARLVDRLEAGPADFLGKALSAAAGAERVDELAKSLRTNSPRLRSRTRALNIPGPRELLRWGRLIRAFGFQSVGVGSVAHLAYHTGYADPGSLCRLFRDLLGHTPGDVSCSDAESLVAEGILREAG